MQSNMRFVVFICFLIPALFLSFPGRLAQGSDGAGSSYLAADVRPAPPRNLSAIQQGRKVLLRWETPEPANEITKYRIYRLRGSNDSFLPDLAPKS